MSKISCKVFIQSSTSFTILLLVTSTIGSKLNELVIRSIDEIFDGSNNLIHDSQVNSTAIVDNGPVLSSNPWHNEGYIAANATAITSSLGSKIDISTKLLLATKSSTLTTQLKDFKHTFLSIKFSSIIGYTQSEQELEEKPDSLVPAPDPPQSITGEESGENVPVTASTTTPVEVEETSPSTEKPLTITDVPPVVLVVPIVNSNKTPIVKPAKAQEKIFVKPSIPVPQIVVQPIENISKTQNNQQSPIVAPIPQLSQTSKASSGVVETVVKLETPAVNPSQADSHTDAVRKTEPLTVADVIPQSEPELPHSAILKLNAEGSDGHQVIEIAIDPAALSGSASKKLKRSENYDSLDDIDIKSGSEIIRKERKRRELNSEEITQIHKILTLTKNIKTKDKTKEKKPKLKAKTIREEIFLAQEAEGLDDVIESELEESETEEGRDKEKKKLVKKVEEVKKKETSTAKKLSYDVWRASMQKSFRPPGFYVTVDDKVVYDNWVGVWQSSQSPSVMGRWSSPKSNGIWNDTVLLMEFTEDPDRNVKISFEWEPTDPHSYLFLSNISISTYGSDSTAKNIELSNTLNLSAASSESSQNLLSSGNKNITLYIVVKAPEGPNSENKGNTKEKWETHNVPVQKTEFLPNGKVPSSPASINLNKLSPSAGQKNTSYVVLIVACATGVFFFVILVFLIYKKLQLSRRRSSIC